MSEEVIDALLVKLGVTVDQASFDESTKAVTGLDNAINRAARERGKTGIDQVGKNMAATGASAKGLERVVDSFDKTVSRIPRSVGVMQSRLGSATQQMASFRKETQAAVSLLSRGAGAAGLGPLAGGAFAMLAGGGPLALLAAGAGALGATAFNYSNGALNTNINASTYGVSMGDYQNLNRFGKSVTGRDGVGDEVLSAAQRIKMSSSVGQIPIDIARYGASPADFADANKRSTLDVVDIIQKQLKNARTDIDRQNIGSALGLSQTGIMTLGEDYRTGMNKYDPKASFTKEDLDNAKKFQDSLVDLTTSFEKLSNNIGKDVLPKLDDFVKGINRFLSNGGGLEKYSDAMSKMLSGDWKGAAKAFGEAEKSTQVITQEQADKASNFVMEHMPFDKLAHYTYDGAMSGWEKDGLRGAVKGAKVGFDASPVIATPWIDEKASSAWSWGKDKAGEASNAAGNWLAPYDKRVMAKRDQYTQFFTDNGYTKEQASGIVGNLMAESTLNAGAVGDNGQAYGLAQWHPDRQQGFKDFFGSDIKGSSDKDQLQFILYELQNKEKSAGRALSRTTTAAEAASVFRNQYERPADNKEDEARRIQYAYQAHAAASDGEPRRTLETSTPMESREDEARRILAANQAAAPETYSMVANPPAPPTVDASGAPDASQAGNVIHIDARGSTDPHRATSEAVRAVNEQLQGQMTVTMSHMSTDLDQ